MSRRDPWTWVGLVVVGVTALVWSFTALSDLARRCGVTAVIELFGVRAEVSWGLPITVDVLALVATRVWLRGDAPDEAVTYARRAAWAAIVATVVGNGYHGLIVGSFAFDALIVSAAPAVVIGVIVHLAVLVARPDPASDEDDQPTELEREADASTPSAESLGGDDMGSTTTPDEAPPPDAAPPPPPPPSTPIDHVIEMAAEWGAAELRAGRTAGWKRIRSVFPELSEHYADKASKAAKDRATPVDA